MPRPNLAATWSPMNTVWDFITPTARPSASSPRASFSTNYPIQFLSSFLFTLAPFSTVLLYQMFPMIALINGNLNLRRGSGEASYECHAGPSRHRVWRQTITPVAYALVPSTTNADRPSQNRCVTKLALAGMSVRTIPSMKFYLRTILFYSVNKRDKRKIENSYISLKIR